MAVVRDIESEVESAFKTVLAISNDIGAVVPRSWKDGGSARTLPAILVHCSPVGNNEGTPNGTLWIANVELAVQTDSTKDKNQAVLKSYLGAIRDVLAQSNIETLLTAASDVTFAVRGLNQESGTHTIDDDSVNQISITVTSQIIK